MDGYKVGNEYLSVRLVSPLPMLTNVNPFFFGLGKSMLFLLPRLRWNTH